MTESFVDTNEEVFDEFVLDDTYVGNVYVGIIDKVAHDNSIRVIMWDSIASLHDIKAIPITTYVDQSLVPEVSLKKGSGVFVVCDSFSTSILPRPTTLSEKEVLEMKKAVIQWSA